MTTPTTSSTSITTVTVPTETLAQAVRALYSASTMLDAALQERDSEWIAAETIALHKARTRIRAEVDAASWGGQQAADSLITAAESGNILRVLVGR